MTLGCAHSPVRKLPGRQKPVGRGRNMATSVQQRIQLQPQRSGSQLVGFGFIWLSVMLLGLAGWVAMTQAGRLLRWSKADAEVQRSEVYSRIQGSGRRSTAWGAAVTMRYLVHGQPMVTTVDRGFQSALRPWMDSGRGNIPSDHTEKFCSIRLIRLTQISMANGAWRASNRPSRLVW